MLARKESATTEADESVEGRRMMSSMYNTIQLVTNEVHPDIKRQRNPPSHRCFVFLV